MPITQRKRSSGNTDLVRQYLVEIGRIPLLKPEQEKKLAYQVSEYTQLLNVRLSLEESLNRKPSLEEWAIAVGLEEASLNYALAKGMKAKKELIESNLRLVVSIAKQYSKRGMELLPLIQEGNIGLQRAAEKFDVERGYKFSTYAYWWIRQAITRAIAEKSRTIRVPVHITEKLNMYKKASRQLTQELGRTPRRSEIAERMEVGVEEVERILSYNRKTLSLSTGVGEERDTELIDLIPDESSEPVLEDDTGSVVESLLDLLSPKERDVIRLRFGLETGEPLSLAEIGRRFDCSRERIRQIETKAMRQLRSAIKRRKMQLAEFL